MRTTSMTRYLGLHTAEVGGSSSSSPTSLAHVGPCPRAKLVEAGTIRGQPPEDADAMSRRPDDPEQRWRSRWEDLQPQIWDLHVRREIYDGLDEAILARGLPEAGRFLDVQRPMYAEAQAMTVRRLVDTNQRTNSLRTLVADLEANRDLLTFDRFTAIGGYNTEDEHDLRFARDRFAALSDDGVIVSSEYLADLQRRLWEAGATVRAWVNQHVAHLDAGRESSVTWGDLHRAFDDLSLLYTEVGGLVTGAHHVPEPGISWNWRKVFWEPLFLNPERRREKMRRERQ
jgi:AbiU2